MTMTMRNLKIKIKYTSFQAHFEICSTNYKYSFESVCERVKQVNAIRKHVKEEKKTSNVYNMYLYRIMWGRYQWDNNNNNNHDNLKLFPYIFTNPKKKNHRKKRRKKKFDKVNWQSHTSQNKRLTTWVSEVKKQKFYWNRKDFHLLLVGFLMYHVHQVQDLDCGIRLPFNQFEIALIFLRVFFLFLLSSNALCVCMSAHERNQCDN